MVQLQKQGWVELGPHKLNAGASGNLIEISAAITDLGKAQEGQLVQYVIHYLSALKKKPLPRALDEERQQLKAGQKKMASYFDMTGGHASSLSAAMIDPEVGFDKWREAFLGPQSVSVTEEEYQSFWGRLQLEKPLVRMGHPDFQKLAIAAAPMSFLDNGGYELQMGAGSFLLTDTVYDYAFPVERLSGITTEDSVVSATLPPQNPFVPVDFSLSPEQYTLFSQQTGEWGDFFLTSFPDNLLPWTQLSLLLFSPDFDLSSHDTKMFYEMLGPLLNFQWGQEFYPAQVANYQMSANTGFYEAMLEVRFSGWSGNFAKTFEQVLEGVHLQISKDLFDEVKKQRLDLLKNDLKSKPSGIAVEAVISSMNQAHKGLKSRIESLENWEFEEFQEMLEVLKSSAKIKGLISGNVFPDTVSSIVQSLEEQWGLSWEVTQGNELPYYKAKKSPYEQKEIIGPDPDNGFYMSRWVLAEPASRKEEWMGLVLGKWLGPDFYHQLRTVEQKAYAVSSSASYRLGIQQMYLMIQSSHPMNEVRESVDSFFRNWLAQDLPIRTEEDLEKSVVSLREGSLYPAENSRRHQWILNQIFEGRESMNAYEQWVGILESINLEELKAWGAKRLEKSTEPDFSVGVTKKQ